MPRPSPPPLLLAALAALSLSACLDDGGNPADAGPEILPDEGMPDEGMPDEGMPDVTPPDGGPACDGPDPSALGCTTDPDCPDGYTCYDGPGACVPSACACEDDGWICTADCGLGPACVEEVPDCEVVGCHDGFACVDHRCVPEGGDPCVRDFDCPGGYCDTEAGACVRRCEGDGEPVLCDALPPVCGVGAVEVEMGGCYACLDARTCEPEVEMCWGAWVDETGACRAPNDGAYPPECCTAEHYRLQFGVIEPSCAPDDGPAFELRFGFGALDCNAVPALRVEVYRADPPRGESVVLEAAGGRAFRCDGPACEAAETGVIRFADDDFHEASGRLWVRFADGTEVQTAFGVEGCPGMPPGCG